MSRKTTSPWTPELVELAMKLYSQGLSRAQVAADILKATGVKVSRNAVVSKIHRQVGPLRPRPPSKSERAAAALRGGGGSHFHKAKPKPAKAKELAPTPARQPQPRLREHKLGVHGAPKGESAVRYMDSVAGQCLRFCGGESGALGFVCGRPTRLGSPWCASCRSAVYVPQVQRAA